MESLTSLDILTYILSAIVLAIVLVLIFYKPGKKLHLYCQFSAESNSMDRIEMEVENNGRKRVKVRAPYVKFSQLTNSIVYQVSNKHVDSKFPKLLVVNQKVRCNIDIGHYYKQAEKHFKPDHVKIILKDTVGMQFPSQTLDL